MLESRLARTRAFGSIFVAFSLLAACGGDDDGDSCSPVIDVRLVHADDVVVTNAESRTLLVESQLAGEKVWNACFPAYTVDPGEGFDEAPMIPRRCSGTRLPSGTTQRTMELRVTEAENVVASASTELPASVCENVGTEEKPLEVSLKLVD